MHQPSPGELLILALKIAEDPRQRREPDHQPVELERNWPHLIARLRHAAATVLISAGRRLAPAEQQPGCPAPVQAS